MVRNYVKNWEKLTQEKYVISPYNRVQCGAVPTVADVVKQMRRENWKISMG